MKFSLTAAREYEAQGIALLAGASYVAGTLDDTELRRLITKDFSSVQWQSEAFVVIIRGARGKLAVRFAQANHSEDLLRFKTPPRTFTHASTALLKAQVMPAHEFFRSLSDAPVRRATKLHRRQDCTGLLLGDETSTFSALLSVENGYVQTTDLEPQPRGAGGREATITAPGSSELEASVRSRFAELIDRADFAIESPFSSNTRLAFSLNPQSLSSCAKN